MVQTPVRADRSVGQQTADPASQEAESPSLPYQLSCTVLTPSGTLIARGQAIPRKRDHLAEAYSVRLTEIEPSGVLEAMVYSDQHDIVLRAEGVPELTLRIDHIIGSPQQREFFCHRR